MEIVYRKEWNRSYLVMLGEEGETVSDYQLRMIQENQIGIFLPLTVRQVDRHLEAYYDMTGLQTLEQWMEHRFLRTEQLRGIFEGLLAAEKAAEDYLLEENRILLRRDCILIQPETWKVFFCFGFSANQTLMDGVRELMQQLLTRLDHSDQESIRVGYTLYQNCQQEPCSLNDLLGVFAAERRKMPESHEGEEEWFGETEVLTELPAYVPAQSYKTSGQEMAGVTLRQRNESIPGRLDDLSEKEARQQRLWSFWSLASGGFALAFLLLCLYTDIQERMTYSVRVVVTVVLSVNCVIGFWRICKIWKKG